MYEVTAPNSRPSVHWGLAAAVWITGILLSMWLRILVPPFLSPAAADDSLMVNLANAILRGEWLGEWNFLTLAKAPGYAILSSSSAQVGLPVTVTVHFFYLVGVILAALFVQHTFSLRLGTITLLVLAFNPVMFGTEASRVYREGLITALILISTSLAGLLGLRLPCKPPNRMQGWLALALGFSLGFLFITKIDALLYTVPAVAIVFLSSLMVSGRAQSGNRLQLGKAPLPAILSIFGLALPPLLVMGMNTVHYNMPVIEDTLNGPIPALMTSLSSIDVGRNPQYVAVSKLQRQEAYEVSSSAKRLEPFLDPTPQGMSRLIDPCIDANICGAYVSPPSWQVGIWRILSCSSLDICDEASTWFQWNLRDALMLASDAGSEEFYELATSAADEIDGACASGRLACTSAFLPSLGNSGNIRLPSLDVAVHPILLESLRFSGADQARPDSGIEANTQQDWAPWDPILGWYSPTSGLLSPSEMTRIVITILQKTYAVAVLVLLLPSLIGVVVAIIGGGRQRWLALISCGFATGWLLQILMLAFLEVNQGTYISEAPQYLLNTSSLLILFLITATWLLFTTITSKFEVSLNTEVRNGERCHGGNLGTDL